MFLSPSISRDGNLRDGIFAQLDRFSLKLIELRLLRGVD